MNNQHSDSHKGRQSWSYRIIIHLICATALDVHRVEGYIPELQDVLRLAVLKTIIIHMAE